MLEDKPKRPYRRKAFAGRLNSKEAFLGPYGNFDGHDQWGGDGHRDKQKTLVAITAVRFGKNAVLVPVVRKLCANGGSQKLPLASSCVVARLGTL